MLQSLPSPYEVHGGDNAFFQENSNIAGLSQYDQYLQPLEGGLSESFSDVMTANWQALVAVGAYGLVRTDSLGLQWGIVAGLGSLYFPRVALALMSLDAFLLHMQRALTRSTLETPLLIR